MCRWAIWNIHSGACRIKVTHDGQILFLDHNSYNFGNNCYNLISISAIRNFHSGRSRSCKFDKFFFKNFLVIDKSACDYRATKSIFERRKCWLPELSPFSTMFTESFSVWVVKTHNCVIKGLILLKSQTSAYPVSVSCCSIALLTSELEASCTSLPDSLLYGCKVFLISSKAFDVYKSFTFLLLVTLLGFERPTFPADALSCRAKSGESPLWVVTFCCCFIEMALFFKLFEIDSRILLLSFWRSNGRRGSWPFLPPFNIGIATHPTQTHKSIFTSPYTHKIESFHSKLVWICSVIHLNHVGSFIFLDFLGKLSVCQATCS